MRTTLLAVLMTVTGFCFSAAGDPEIKLYLRNGDIMTGTAKLTSVTLVTDYGKLVIPLRSVSSIKVGIIPAKDIEQKVHNLITQLKNSDEKMRKAAAEELAGLPIGAIPVISDLIYSGNYESSEYSDFTAEDVLQQLMSSYHVSDSYSTRDVVTIDFLYTMGGIFEFSKIDLKTPHSTSPQSIQKDQILEIEVLNIPGDGNEKSFTLLASKHISSNNTGGWLKTGIMLKAGQKFSIYASGEITLQSLSGNKYKPDGSVTPAAGNTGQEGMDDNPNSGGIYPAYGNVVFRVGETGTTMKAGARFLGPAPAAGMLYISIYETVYSDKNSGNYNVKISLK
ncbi:MAG: hypothetical protein IT233_11900 [Bacteroidia bacterium]|nr:hypothetical protein [Bacteroidia bacterium]